MELKNYVVIQKSEKLKKIIMIKIVINILIRLEIMGQNIFKNENVGFF